MALTFADTHNMIAYLTKSDASEGFNQIIDFLNGSSIKYALTVNPNIYVSCIKQFWTSVAVKKVNDVTRLQALVDKKKVIITESIIRDALHLDDAEGVECLPNEEIFVELTRMGYEKTSTKLTFYKAFFSSQWKFLIHTILQCMSAKRTSWNEFSSSMASAVICLSTGRKLNFSKYIFDSLVRNVDSSTKFYMYPRFLQLMISAQVGDLSSHTTMYSSPTLTQKVFANMKNVGKGCSGVETPLFEGMIVAHQVGEGAAKVNVEDVSTAGVTAEGAASTADDEVPAAIDEPYIPSPTPPTIPPQPSQDIPSTSQVQPTPPLSTQAQLPSPQHQPQPSQDAGISMNLLQNLLDTCTTLTRRGRMIADMDADVDVTLKDVALDAEIEESADKEDNAAKKYQALKRKPQNEAQARKNMMIYLRNFLIHTILQSMSVKRTSWNEFSSVMASAVICLSTAGEPEEQCDAEEEVQDQDLEIIKLKTRVKKLEKANKVKALKLRRLRKVGTSQRVDTSDDTIMEDVSNQGRMIDELDRDEGVVLIGEKEEEKKAKEVKDITDEPEVKELVEVVTTAKLITEVVTAASTPVSVASTIILAAELKVLAATITTTPVKPKDKGKGIMVEEPKPMKKKEQVKMDEAYARKLHEELN
nr:hypothetical protein [Tanacetum cinerariifolium]